MAARRLVILVLAVLAISTLGAALIAPRPGGPGQATTTTKPRGVHGSAPRQRSGRLIVVGVRTRSPQPESIHLGPGDQLELSVRSATPGQIEIPRFGQIEDAGPDMPAHFSLLVDEPESFAVRIAATGRAVARIVVSPPRGASRAPRGGGRS